MPELTSFLTVTLLAASVAFLLARRYALRRERVATMLSGDTKNGRNPSRPFAEKLRHLVASLPPRQARVLAWGALAATAFALTRNPVIALLAWPAARTARRILISHRRKKSLARKEEQVLELIDSLSQSLRSGLSLQLSLEVGLEDVGEEIRGDILDVLKELRLGSSLEEALSKAADCSPLPSLKLTYTVLGLLHGKGGDLPRILERVRKRVAEGLEARREAQVLTSQSRASGYLVASLPAVFLGLQAILNPRSLSPLLYTRSGNMIAVTAIALNAAALFLIRRIVSPEV